MWNIVIVLFALFSLLDLFWRIFPPIQISFKVLCPERSTSARLLIQLRLIGFVPYKVASWNIGSATGIPKTKASLKEIRHVNISVYCEVNKMGGSMSLLLHTQLCLAGGHFGFKPRAVTTVKAGETLSSRHVSSRYVRCHTRISSCHVISCELLAPGSLGEITLQSYRFPCSRRHKQYVFLQTADW